jgi:hypothetical protein
MIKPIAYACAAGLALLAGCERGTPEADDKKIQVPEGDYHARLEAMPEAQRNAVFIRAIRDAGRDCQHVERSQRTGEINGAPAWTATCDNDVQWTIAIGRAGVAQVMSTAELQAAAGAGKQTR